MNESPPTSPPSPDGSAATTARSVIADVEAALTRTIEPFLTQAKQAVKQAVLGAVEEVVTKYGSGLGAEVRQTLRSAVDELVKAQVGRLVAELAPSGDGARRLAEGLHAELRDFANTTLRDLFDNRLPEYSAWAGQRIIDHAIAGVLFVIAAVLLCVGGVLGLQAAGVAPYVTYLVGGAVALAGGSALLRLRSRSWASPPTATQTPEPTEPPAKPPGAEQRVES